MRSSRLQALLIAHPGVCCTRLEAPSHATGAMAAGHSPALLRAPAAAVCIAGPARRRCRRLQATCRVRRSLTLPAPRQHSMSQPAL